MLPFLFRTNRNPLAIIPPTPTGQRFSARADGDTANFLSVAEANFDLETSQWHGYAWVRFNTLPSVAGHVIPIVGQYDDVPMDSAFVLGVVNTGAANVFAFGTCRLVLGVNVFDNTLATNWLANHGDLQTGVWYFVDFWLNTIASETGLRVNSAIGGMNIELIADLPACSSAVDLTTFRWTGGPHATQDPMDGRQGGMAFRRGSLWSNGEISYLYNAGCELLFSEINAGLFPNILTDLYAIWDMQEDWGQTRINQQGTAARNLLNNGVVGQSCGTCWVCTSSLLILIYGAYHADEASGILVDSSGNGRDFADTNTVGSMSGQFAGARAFVNANLEEFFRVNEAAQGWTTGLSAAFWFRPENFLTQQSLFQKYSLASGKFQLQMLVTTGFIRFNFDTPAIFALLSVAPTLLSWNHLAFSYDGAGATNADRFKIYLGGVLQSLTFTGTVPATLAVSAARLRIGGANTLDNYQGGIDEMIILSRPMTASEVLQHKSSVFPWST